MLPEDLGHGIGAAKQGVVIGLDALQQVEQNGIVPLEEGGTAGLEIKRLPCLPAEGKPQGEEITAEGHVLLPAGSRPHPGPFQQQDRPLKMSLHERGLGIHHQLGPLPVALGDLIIMGHTLVHLGQLLAQLPGSTVVHHQHRGGTERPAAAVAQGNGRAGHLAAGTAVEAAHPGDIVVHQKAQNEVALAQQVAPLLGRKLRVLPHGGFQQGLELHHFGDLLAGEHPAHQHQNGQRVPLKGVHRAAAQPFQQLRRAEGCQQDAGVLLNDMEGGVIIPAFFVGTQGGQILPPSLVPAAIPFPDGRLPRGGQLGKQPLGAFFHHVVEPEALAVRHPGDKGVLPRQGQQHLLGVRHPGHGRSHLYRKLIGQAHHGQKLLPLRRQGLDHGCGEHGIDVRAGGQQGAPLRQRVEIEVDGREPALAGVEQGFPLGLRQLHAAAADVGG